MFILFSGRHIGVLPVSIARWRFHTGLSKFLQKISTNIWSLGEGAVLIYLPRWLSSHLSFHWLFPLVAGFRFLFYCVTVKTIFGFLQLTLSLVTSTEVNMKSQVLRLHATLLFICVACFEMHGAVQEVCTTVQYDVDVRVVGCQSRTVKLNICAGTCLSEESWTSETCWCCKPASRVPVDVEILCQSGNGAYKQIKTVYEHVQCTCSRCFEN